MVHALFLLPHRHDTMLSKIGQLSSRGRHPVSPPGSKYCHTCNYLFQGHAQTRHLQQKEPASTFLTMPCCTVLSLGLHVLYKA